MDKKNQILAKAGLAFLSCISCCAFANYVTYEVIVSFTDGGMFADLWFFLVYVIQVVTALMSAIYGDALLKRGRLLKDWHSTKDLPDKVCGEPCPDVIFMTIDGCLFNGIYDSEDQQFHGWDSLDFPLDEVMAWTNQKISFRNTNNS